MLGITVLYGLSDEMHQIFTPGRTPRLFDLLFDTLGALLVVWWLHRAVHKTKPR